MDDHRITIIGADDIQARRSLGFTGQDLIIGKAESISDGYHTFEELYDHRISIFIALCKAIVDKGAAQDAARVWRSKRHSDGELCFGTGTQYVLGIGKEAGEQMTYHIPIERWDETDFVQEIERAPEFDGHTSADVLARLKTI